MRKLVFNKTYEKKNINFTIFYNYSKDTIKFIVGTTNIIFNFV